MTNFDDIRPYNDDEVKSAVARLIADKEFLRSVASFNYPKASRLAPWLMQTLVKRHLSTKVKNVNSIKDLQTIVESYLDRVIETTTTKLSFSGLEKLDPSKPYLFISNHRDIVLDPAFVNYALYHNEFDTVRIAIGDNLVQKPFVSDLMRLNKSFIVKRSAEGVREKMNAYMGLSSYVHHSIEEGHPIWIAQREGRAKDGIDVTEAAIIKMIYMCQKKNGMSFSDYISWLHIVPIVISYEYNPCDQIIARELHIKNETGSYTKAPGEDLTSITTGITGNKGHVHVAFGDELQGTYEDAEAVAAELDKQMLEHYVFHDSHLTAAELLQGDTKGNGKIDPKKAVEFEARIEQSPPEYREILLKMYANPVLRAANNRS